MDCESKTVTGVGHVPGSTARWASVPEPVSPLAAGARPEMWASTRIPTIPNAETTPMNNSVRPAVLARGERIEDAFVTGVSRPVTAAEPVENARKTKITAAQPSAGAGTRACVLAADAPSNGSRWPETMTMTPPATRISNSIARNRYTLTMRTRTERAHPRRLRSVKRTIPPNAIHG